MQLSRRGEITAVAVLSIVEPNEVYPYRRGFLVDLVVSPHDRPQMLGVLGAARAACRQRNVDSLVVHLINARLEASLRAYGFLRREPTRILVICPAGESDEVRQAVLAADNWLITMGDSDIDRPTAPDNRSL